MNGSHRRQRALMLFKQVRHVRSRWLVLAHDWSMIPVAWLLAYWFRYNLSTIPNLFFREAYSLLPIVICIYAASLAMFRVHRGVWRFISVSDLVRLVKAVVVGTVLVAVAIFFVTRLQYVPRSVFLLSGLFLICLLAAPRLIYRLAKDRHISAASERKVLVVGAGASGELLVRDLLRSTPRRYEPVAFVDDDLSKRGKEIHGIRVLGDCTTIPLLCERYAIELIMIAMPNASARQMQRVVDWCEKAGVSFRILPRLDDLVNRADVSRELRRVRIDDLLGRDPVSLDRDAISRGLRGKRILVTGGGGSIGSELCRQIARLEPETLIVFEQTEFNLYTITMELARQFPALAVVPMLGDVRDRRAVEHVFEAHRPDVVFHAAAYKHVPLLQEQMRETVKNNVLGTRIVADAADAFGCESFVQISTDKAVNPSSMMGASKRIAEIYCQSLSEHSHTRYITVRFGNVLGSAGSVIPLFTKQIEEGGPVTVTHPDVTRYMMTTSEACQLILQASVIGKSSEIYVLNMGEPIKISYLARQMIRLSGKLPGEEIEIVYIGLRPGEKLEEELFHPDEALADTGFEKILLAKGRGVGYERVAHACDRLRTACEDYRYDEIGAIVEDLVPEYVPGGDTQTAALTGDESVPPLAVAASS